MGKYTSKQLIGFILPSVVGILLFMIPIQVDDSWTIVVKLIADIIGDAFAGFLPILCVIIVTVSAVLGVASLGKPSFITSYPIINETFTATPIWAIIRVIGCLFIWITFLGLGLDADGEIAGPLGYISTGDAGGFVLDELLTVLVVIFLLAGLLLPLLLDFGLLEFIGALLTKVMRPLFKIPGRAAVDCITSWIGDGTLGVMLTANQYGARSVHRVDDVFSSVHHVFHRRARASGTHGLFRLVLPAHLLGRHRVRVHRAAHPAALDEKGQLSRRGQSNARQLARGI